MGIPTLLSPIYSGTYCRVIFDEAITATGGQELNGFTFVLDGTPITPTFVSYASNAIQVNLGGPVTSTLTVAYNGGTGTVVSVSTSEPAATFTTTDAVAYPTIAVTMRADAGQPANDSIRIYFSQPVASTDNDLVAGFTINVNGTPLVLTGATASLNSTLDILTITTGTDVAYSDTVDVIYDSGPGTLFAWPDAVTSFEFTQIPNLSTDGLPNSQYPLSWVTSYTPMIEDRTVVASLGVTLNPIDVKLVAEYGPALLLTGGTFGVTMANPAGISILGHQVIIIDGVLFAERFTQPGTPPSWLVAAANDWQTTMINKIGQILGQYRAIDQTLTLHGQTVSAV